MNAVLAYIDFGDRRVSHRLADWNPPRWFRQWMILATRLGDGWLWSAIALVLLALGDYFVLIAAGISCCLANLVMIVLKKRFRRRKTIR